MKKIAYKKMAGFSLVELMVGLVIGLITTLAITNVFTQFEGRKRVVAGGADAQTNGNLALYNIQRDLENAGYGLPLYLNSPSPLLCPLSTTITQDGATMNLSPVVITDGGNASDTISVRYGTTAQGGSYQEITGGTLDAPVLGASFVAFQPNDIVLMQQVSGVNNLCTLGRVSTVNSNNTIKTVVELTTNTASERVTGIAATNLANLGVWNQYQFTVNAKNELTRTGGMMDAVKFPDSTVVPIISEVVSLQAQYGLSADKTSNKITHWEDATGNYGALMTLGNRNLIKALRVAVVTRDGQLQKTNVSQACDGNTAGLSKVCIWNSDTTPSKVTISNANWQRYRYREYEAIIPLRNIIWNRDAI